MTGPEAKPSHIQEMEAWAASAFQSPGPKLTFSEKCGIAYALKMRAVDAPTVREAFGLSSATVSWLKHCLQPGALHYRKVWREWQDLGPEAFGEKYYTRDLHFRFRRVRYNLGGDENQTDRAPKVASAMPAANQYRGSHTLPDGSIWEIEFLRDRNPPGWAFRSMERPEVWHGKERLRGAGEWHPFSSSHATFDGVYEINQFPNPRKED